MNKKLPHAAPPRVCDACMETIVADTDRAPNADHVAYCPHHFCFVLARVRSGTICQYDLVGPLLPTEVAEMKKSMADHAKREGIPFIQPKLN